MDGADCGVAVCAATGSVVKSGPKPTALPTRIDNDAATGKDLDHG